MWKNIHLPTLAAGIFIFLMLFVAYKIYTAQKDQQGAKYPGPIDTVTPGW